MFMGRWFSFFVFNNNSTGRVASLAFWHGWGLLGCGGKGGSGWICTLDGGWAPADHAVATSLGRADRRCGCLTMRWTSFFCLCVWEMGTEDILIFFPPGCLGTCLGGVGVIMDGFGNQTTRRICILSFFFAF